MDDGRPPRDGAGSSAPPLPDPQQLARDWITLCQSELSAAAADREVQEGWQAMAALWAGAAAAMLRGSPRGADGGTASRPAGAAAPARAAAAAAAPDARDAEIDRLARRVAELERRLADLERGDGG